MKYSIVIPTYNHCDDLLKPCIQSIINYSTLLNTEIVVVANGCTDNTRSYVESLGSNFKLVWFDEALGYTKAANHGIKNSSGDYVILLNNDTEILPSAPDQWLETLNQPFKNNSKMALTGSLKLFDHDIQREFIVFCCAMIRRSAFDNLGLLDEIFNPGYGEDIDFAMRIEAAGLQWMCIDETKFINGTNIGSFPLWHKNNKTFGEIAEYGSIVGRNRQILIDRYAKTPSLKYSIVIPTYNHCSDYLQPCLESIKKYTDLSIIEVLVVANGCIDNTREYVQSLGYPFKLIWHDEPLGYTIATNLGIKEARGEYVILLNNDVILLEQTTNLWLELLENPFKSDPKTGITGPMKFSWDCGGVIRESMAFWLVMMRRSLFSEIGLLDEIFSPGMGEDGDFSVKTVEAGYNLVPYDQPFAFETGPIKTQFPIWHKGNGTFADNNDHKNKIIDRNNRILAYRWGLQSKKHIEVSIVIPTAHNFHNALKPCLEAIFAYTDLSDKEIIVVPNGSTQEAREFLNEHTDKLTYIWSDKPTGVVRAYNAGINASRGKYIVTIDDDSILMAQERDTWINILKKPFLEEERIGASGPFAHEYDGLGFVIHSGCTMYDAELLKRIGGFDEEFNPGYFSDPDVSLRIWEQGYRCVEVPVDRANKNYTGTVFSVNFPVVHMGTVQTMNKNTDIAIVAANREKLYLRHSKKMISKNLEDMYKYICTLDYDTKEHIPTLRKYAEECSHITEFGTRFVVSTYGLLAGKPKKLLTYDIVPDPAIWRAATLAKENNIEFGFVEKNVLQAAIEPTDLLFVDTLHNYSQLKKELEIHADKVKKYIICHDTETYGYKDQMGDGPGLMQAINEFLAANPIWTVKEKYTNCNGLVVLQRSAVEILPAAQNTDRKVKYSIVIPTYNHCDDLLKPCIESIKKYSTLDNLEVVVVANGCIDDTRSYVEGLGEWVKLVWVDEAIGYTKATNLGIKASTGDYIVLLNNDTELLPQAPDTWLNILNEPFKEADVGLTGPLQLYDNYAGSNALIFFCVMVSRKLFNEIGILDEIFTPGGGEDIDFTVRANLAGYRSICISDTRYSTEAGTNVGQFPIWHKDNRTFRDIEEYGRYIVKRNGLINCKRFNKNIKLNLGSGGIDYPGYLSVDLHDKRALIHMDITKLDFDDNSVTEILASHVFEHLNPYHALDILKDWLRVLKPGGKLVMEMPDLERLCARFAAADTGTRYGIANVIYGSVNTTGVGGPDNITSPHLFGWWPQSLWDHLTNAGFTGIVFMEEQIPHPMDNLRVEAVKPL